MQALLELAADDPQLRRTLPMGVDVGDADQLDSDLEATIEALAERIRSISAADVAQIMERRARGSSRPAPLGPLAQAQALETLDPDTLVRVRSQQRVTLEVGDGERDHRPLPEDNLTFAPATPPMRSHAVLHSRDGIRVGDIPGLSDEQRLELVATADARRCRRR